MSRIFKSNYVKVGTPKHLKSNAPEIKKEETPKAFEVHQAQSLEERANGIIEDAKQMYLRIIEEANQEAQKIKDTANQEKEAILEEAKEKGYNEGYIAGHDEGLNDAEAIIQQAGELKLMLGARTEQIYTEAETEIMEMVLDISKKVLGQNIAENPDFIISLIKKAFEKCAFKDKLTIRVSELDYKYVNDSKEKIIMLTEGINDLEIYCDKALQKGSCIVETPSGEINAGIEVQMNEIQKAFEYLMRNE